MSVGCFAVRGCTAPTSARGARHGARARCRVCRRRRAARSPRSATPWTPRCASSRRRWHTWRRSSPPRTRSWRCREKWPGCWDFASKTGRIADGSPGNSPRRSASRRRAGHWGCRERLGTVIKGRFPGTSSPVQCPPGHCVRPSVSTSSTCSPRRASSDRSPGEVMATLLDDGVYLCSQRTMYRVLAAKPGGARAAQSACASSVREA